jgi:uncharacterized membrane protein
MENKVQIGTVFCEGFANGMKNLPSLLGALVLWILTIWIPYVNVGTTIAVFTLPILMSKGIVFSPLDIFSKKYYRYMGEVFLAIGLMFMGIMAGVVFLIIPGIVISIAWSLAIYLILDKGVNAAEALRLSNKLTFGNKWTLFAVVLIIGIAASICSFIFSLIPFIGLVLNVCLSIVLIAFTLGCWSSIYGTLSKNVEEQN